MRPAAAKASRSASRLCTECRLLQGRRGQIHALPRQYSPRQWQQARSIIPSTASPTQPWRSYSSESTAAASTKPSESSPTDAAAPRTHYDLFPQTLPSGPPPSGHFPIDVRALRREFLQLQARAHPDRHQGPAAKARAEGTSAAINEAYRTLANPLLRAQYLLSLRGVDVANDETLKVEEPGLLALVLEAREEIEDAVEEEDLAGPRDANDERIAESEGRLEKAFQEDDVEAAKREAVRMRYWVNIRDSLDNWEKGKPIVLQH